MNVFVLVGVAVFLYMYNKPVADGSGTAVVAGGMPVGGAGTGAAGPPPGSVLTLKEAPPKSAGFVYGLLT